MEAMPAAAETAPATSVRKMVLISVAILISMLSVLAFDVARTGNECPGLPSDQAVASAAVRYAACNHSSDAWSKGAR